jgi:two-component system response regulator PilR (NtrC family)
MVADGSFRQDLYYRINVIGITVPTLAERVEDIPQLADFLIEKHNYHNSSSVKISDEALAALEDYAFPGNVRELENILERALALCEHETIEATDLQLPEINATNNGDKQPSLGEMTQNLEKEHIINALEDNRWNQSATARALGLTLRQLRYRIDKLKLKER